MASASDLSRKYDKFVINNHAIIGNIESGIRVLSYFVTGQSQYSAVVSELLYSATNLLVFLNDAILRKAADIKLKVPLPNKQLCTWLSVLEYTEVFLEIAARGFGGEFYHWLIIVCVQITKAVIKYILLLKYNSGIQQSPVIPALKRGRPLSRKLQEASEVAEYSQLLDQTSVVNHEVVSQNPVPTDQTFTLTRSGRHVRTLDAAPPLLQRSWKVPDPVNNLSPTHNLDHTVLSTKQMFAECLHISRPLAHLLSMYLFGQHSWKPWLVACGVDASKLWIVGDTQQYSIPEREELRRRTALMILYLLRSPFYDRYSKTKLLVILNGMAKYIPGVRLVIRPLLDYLPWWQRVYFYVWMT